MSVISLPPGGKSRRTVDPLPRSVLHSLISDIPGPKNETEAERVVRFDAQLGEVLGYGPRNSAEAMLAIHCILLKLLAKDTLRDANEPGLSTEAVKKYLRTAKQFDRMVANWEATLARRQTQALGEIDAGVFEAPGLTEFLNPCPDGAEDAVSAVIVPLHPAPKMLQ